MKTERIVWLKEFLAAERGVSPTQISDTQAISSHRKRQVMLWIGFLAILSAYLGLRILYNPTAGRVFVALVTTISMALCVLEAIAPSPLNPGGKLAVRRELTSLLSVDTDQVSEQEIQQHYRWDWRNLVYGLIVVAVVGLAFDWIWPKSTLNPLLEVVLLFTFWFVARIVWNRRRRRPD